MLDIEKCRLLIKSAQFDELNRVLEREYLKIFDDYLVQYISKEELDKMMFVEKAKIIMQKKPEMQMLILRIINCYLNEENEIDLNINTLLTLYKPTLEMLNK